MSERAGVMIANVLGALPPELASRLGRVAADFARPGGLRVSSAVALAEDFVAAGYADQATVEVASLRRDAIRSDAEPLIRTMLSVHEIDVPEADDDEGAYQLLLRAFACWDLHISDLYPPFLRHLPAWDEQSTFQRELIVRFEDLDHATSPAKKRRIEDRMRRIVRQHLEDASG